MCIAGAVKRCGVHPEQPSIAYRPRASVNAIVMRLRLPCLGVRGSACAWGPEVVRVVCFTAADKQQKQQQQQLKTIKGVLFFRHDRRVEPCGPYR